MALERVVCCLLLLHCIWARDEFSIDKLSDIVDDRVDSESNDRDDHFWDEDYWTLPFQQDLQCPDNYGWVGDFANGTCRLCEGGTQKFDDHWKERCKPCSAGYFRDSEIRSYCSGCPDRFGRATTFILGARNAEECVDPEEMFGDSSYQSEVSIEVKLSGDWSWAEDIMWQLSGVNLYEMRAHVSYDETDDTSTAKARAMLPNYLAMYTYQQLLDFKKWQDEVNEYASMADHYAKMIFRIVDHSDLLSLLGFQMNYNELNLKNIKILSTTIQLNQDCLDGYYSVDWDGVGSRCEQDNSPSKTKRGKYMMYQGKSDLCKSLGGEAKIREFVETSWPFPCLSDDQCEVHLSTCKETSSGQCALVLYLTTDNANIDFYKQVDSADRVEYRDNTKDRSDSTTFEYVTDSVDTNCEGSPIIDDSDNTFQCTSCTDGYYLTKSGNCEMCPFGTWMDPSAKTCNSCPFDRPGTLYGVVAVSEDKCINSFTETWESGIKEWGFEMTDQEFDLNVKAEVNMCEVDRIKNHFKNYCYQKYDMDDISFDEITDLEMLSCTVMSRLSEIYEKSCPDSNYGWNDIIDDFPGDVDLEGTACFVAKSLYYIEQNENSDCETLNSMDRNLQMSSEFSMSPGLMWSGGIWMPLVSNAGKLVKFDFNVVSELIEAVMHKIGIYDMSNLTGLEIMDYMRDLIIAVPRGINVKEAKFDVTSEEIDLFCANGNPRRKCTWGCRYDKCPRFDYTTSDGDRNTESDDEPTCTQDECNNCEEIWTYQGEDNYDCSWTCDAPKTIDNGILSYKEVDWDKEVCPDCYRFVSVYQYACETNYRLKSETECDSDTNDYSRYVSEYICLYKGKDDFKLSSTPECIPENCNYPILENGFIREKVKDQRSNCRYAYYLCDLGYKMEGSQSVSCHQDGSFSDMPRCVKIDDTCVFSERTENARLVMEYSGRDYTGHSDDDAWVHMGWYQCQDGYRLYDYDLKLYQSVRCNEDVSCKRILDECPGIMNGYLVREWGAEWGQWGVDKDYHIGEYRCNPGFQLVSNPNIHTLDGYSDEMQTWGMCFSDGETKLPSCVPDGTPVPCNMPKDTWNGYLVREVENDDGMVTFGQYKCNDGYKMVETWKGDGMGWCRGDGSFEMPYCIRNNEYFEMEFEIESGYRMENAGFVNARMVAANGDEGKWEAGCDDRFNDFAAGAMCRQMGFRHGKKISMKRMAMMSDMEFGWTNINCKYDDTLIMSHNCNADRYGMEGQAVCTPEERLAIGCFDDFWKVSVKFQFVERNRKMFCPVEIIKEGEQLKLKKMGLRVEWGGVTVTGDEQKITVLEENVDYISRGFSNKKGFRAKYTGNTRDYDCFCCEVFMGDTLIHTEYEKNHNCDN